jgi:hypothetical protein
MIGNVTAFNTRLDNFLTEVVELSQNDGLPKTSHSDGVTAVDIDGNVCAISHSINTATMWGTGLFVRGVPLSDAAAGQLNQVFIFDDSINVYPQDYLPTPTREIAAVSPSMRFAIATIGDSLSQVTLQLYASLMAKADPLNYTTNQGQFLNFPTSSLRVSANVCEACAQRDSVCPLQNQQTNCISQAFLTSLPQWISPYVYAMSGYGRFSHSGPMAVAQSSVVDGNIIVASDSSPGGNGGGFIGAS